ncbi:TPM domain-containing protein [Bifidobacterium sp. ESL0800]|nr:TPM domain-containing protein [Bifidobacterium sp. ESL0800]WEV76479.1 TPM domain-containing protein [Bifidobacterium sp. ESL0800]
MVAFAASLLGVVLLFGFAQPARAASSSMGEINAEVTDPQNLLGGNVSHVNDEIASIKQETGVTVRLLYLANFAGSKDPDTWAGESLESTKPPANTVLLALASNDGRLVVAVSHNSDDWLKDKDHVSRLSQAALGPIQKGDDPDWSGAACAMMDEIKVLHKQETSRKPKIIIAGSIAVILVIIVIGAVVMLLRRRGKKKKTGESPSDKDYPSDEGPKTGQTDSSDAAKLVKPKAKGPRHRKKK